VRVSWSWWKLNLAIGKAWMIFRREVGKYSERSLGSSKGVIDSEAVIWTGMNHHAFISRKKMYEAWEKLLVNGWCVVGKLSFFVSGRSLDYGNSSGARIKEEDVAWYS
jgi:hypothetical protein